MDKKSCRHHVLMGNFSTKIGVRGLNDNMKCVGPFGKGSRNERGERLLDFTEENNLLVTNLSFKKQQTDIGHGKPQGV